jgi:hypothetical protein
MNLKEPKTGYSNKNFVVTESSWGGINAESQRSLTRSYA